MRHRKIWAGLVLVLLCTLAMGMSVFAADTTMKNKKWVSGQGGAYVDSDKDGKVDDFQSWGKSYYKIQIPKQGYIVVEVKTSSLPGEKQYNEYYSEGGELESSASTELSLFNSKKKLLGQYNNFDLSPNILFTAAVKKGTYHLAVGGEQKYKIRYSYTSVPKVSRAGSSCKTAVRLKKGRTIKSLITGEKDQYFKLKVAEKSKVTLSFEAKVRDTTLDILEDAGGALNIRILVKKGNSLRSVDKRGKLEPKNSFYYYTVKGKDKITMTLPKGTYYIRAFAWRGTGGYYTMKWR